jgi:galactokinase
VEVVDQMVAQPMTADQMSTLFTAKFGSNDDRIIVRSPGRVNLIGEHTDYNEGFVLPAAIDRAILLAVAPRADDRLRVHAADMGEGFETTIPAMRKSDRSWPNYLLGVVDQMRKAGYGVRGFDCVFGGDIPIGAGMSSSAAIEGGLAFALNEVFDLGIDRLTLVKIAQKAENEFVGVRCGIMDQFINIFGQRNKVLKLDCRSLEYEYFPFERKDVRIVLCDTQVRRALASSEYNVRRQQCETGVEVLRRWKPSIRSLRDVTLDLLGAHRAEMDPVVYRRCTYVVEENARVLRACAHLKANDIHAFGEEMFASHTGLRDKYEVSCRELDVLIELASALKGVFGARMMGAGFGGCTINLVEEQHLVGFLGAIAPKYREAMGKELKLHTARIFTCTAKVSEASVGV